MSYATSTISKVNQTRYTLSPKKKKQKKKKPVIIKNMTSGDFEIAGISTGKWWSSPTNSTTAVFSGYSLPRPTETSLDITDFRRQSFDNKTNNYNDDFINM